MKIGVASDHAGFEMKKHIIKNLELSGFEVIDFGTYNSENSDYADYAHPLAFSIENGECTLGISLCGSGNGINITANKHQAVRSALCWNVEIAKLARLHNDANNCALPARYISNNEANDIVNMFINTKFEGGRHQLRIDKIPVSK